MLDSTQGPARARLSPEQARTLETAGTLIHDDRRLRSFFFDGRFLTARDLTREQTYFLNRQADLGRAGGAGVVSGLMVSPGLGPRSLRIGAGHGITPSGETVVVPRELADVKLDDVAEIQRLDAAFGLSPVPRETARNRSGLYVLALRPVEYTANPVASYPSALGTTRTAQDGDIIEATALTLIPYPDNATGANFDARRSRVAHDIFVRNGGRRPPVDALPLAMVAMDHGVVRWVDRYMVRREVGSEQTDFLGLGQAPRALREAHLLQYQRHLQDVVDERNQAHRGTRFAASEHFFALPPAGPLPSAAIDPTQLTEAFFPPEVDVEMCVIPEDELPALLAESLLLPPIDLTLTGEQFSSVSVMVLVPVARANLDAALARLLPTERSSSVKLRSVAPGLVSRQQPADALRVLIQGKALASAQPANALANAAWGSILAGAQSLWYARRRNFPYKPAIVGERVVEPDDAQDNVTQELQQLGLYDEFSSLPARATALAIGKTYELFRQWQMMDVQSRQQLFAGLAGELLRLKWIELASVTEIQQRYKYTDSLGKGLGSLFTGTFTVPLQEFARSNSTLELDKVASWAVESKRLEQLRTDIQAFLGSSRTLDEVVEDYRRRYPEIKL